MIYNLIFKNYIYFLGNIFWIYFLLGNFFNKILINYLLRNIYIYIIYGFNNFIIFYILFDIE